jgi:fibronectin-binding autotransporter adhesin
MAGQSVIRLVDGSHLTLSGALSDETTAVGVNFVGNFNAGAGTGVLTLNGANTYTGPTVVTNGVLEAATIANVASANSLGKSSAAPANLVLNNGTLRYTGTAAASTDRGFTVQGNSTVQLDGNAGFTGQVVGDASSALTVTGPGTLNLGNTSASANSVGSLQIVNSALTVDANSKLDVVSGQILIGCNGSAGDLTINDGGVLTSTSAARLEIAHIGSSHVVLSGTSTTSPAKLSVGGTAWIGVSLPGEAPSSALVELSGTAEMHLGTAGQDINAHLGLGADTTFTLTMKDDSKFTCGIAAPPEDTRGWFDLGALTSTANITLSDNASLTIPKSHIGLINGSITLNGAATVTSAKYVYAAVDPTDVATITLNGGTFTAPYFFTTSQGVINFNGGALKASAASADFIQGATFAVNVDAGGAKIDSGGVDITVTSVFHNISATTPGGLTKLGDGALTLTAPLTDIGDTTVNQGTLIASAGINTPSDMVYVATGATLTAPSIVADTLTIGGAPVVAATAVPEPGTLALLALAGLFAVLCAWRRK